MAPRLTRSVVFASCCSLLLSQDGTAGIGVIIRQYNCDIYVNSGVVLNVHVPLSFQALFGESVCLLEASLEMWLRVQVRRGDLETGTCSVVFVPQSLHSVQRLLVRGHAYLQRCVVWDVAHPDEGGEVSRGDSAVLGFGSCGGRVCRDRSAAGVGGQPETLGGWGGCWLSWPQQRYC